MKKNILKVREEKQYTKKTKIGRNRRKDKGDR